MTAPLRSTTRGVGARMVADGLAGTATSGRGSTRIGRTIPGDGRTTGRRPGSAGPASFMTRQWGSFAGITGPLDEQIIVYRQVTLANGPNEYFTIVLCAEVQVRAHRHAHASGSRPHAQDQGPLALFSSAQLHRLREAPYFETVLQKRSKHIRLSA